MSKDLRILIADDHKLVVDMIDIVLQSEGGFNTEMTFNLDDALSVVLRSPRFDVILLDLDMPGMNGLTGYERMIAAAPDAAVVMFSGQARQETVRQALRLGVRGYIPKTLAPRSLISAIRFVAVGEIYYPAEMLRHMIEPRREQAAANLSPRELEVIRAVASGSTNKEISIRVGLPETTVKMCVRSVCQKLNVTNRTQIAMTAVSKGLV